MPEVRGGGREEQPTSKERWLHGLRWAKRSYSVSEVSGSREETPHVRGQGRLGEATSCPRPRAVTLRSHPEPEVRAGGQGEPPKERWLSRHRRA